MNKNKLTTNNCTKEGSGRAVWILSLYELGENGRGHSKNIQNFFFKNNWQKKCQRLSFLYTVSERLLLMESF